MPLTSLADLPARNRNRAQGITSVCSAHPDVLTATLQAGVARDGVILIEATCNQVNHEGGYTGMTPADFRVFVEKRAQETGFDTRRLILGGDHLGPNPWRHLTAEDAMARAEKMVEAYVAAGFTKIHLDTSMACADDETALTDETIAARAVRLAKVSEATASRTGTKLHYIVGTEVPPPGGATERLDEVTPTPAAEARRTFEVHRTAFAAAGLDDAFARVIGLVVQPGVEFGSENVHFYDRAAARELTGLLKDHQNLVFEAHSTDYQPAEALAGLVEDGFAILKVGPALTFALRQALYGLDAISAFLHAVAPDKTLKGNMERLMVAAPGNWQGHYHGDKTHLRMQRHFSYSDRIRYYWPQPEAQQAVSDLMARLGDAPIPAPLVRQYLGWLYPDVASGACPSDPHALIIRSIQQVIETYQSATR